MLRCVLQGAGGLLADPRRKSHADTDFTPAPPRAQAGSWSAPARAAHGHHPWRRFASARAVIVRLDPAQVSFRSVPAGEPLSLNDWRAALRAGGVSKWGIL